MRTENHEALLKRGKRLAAHARGWMIWERFAPIYALSALVIALFLIGSFTGLWQRIGDPWRAIAIIFTLYFAVKASFSAFKTRFPTRSDAERRVEKDSGVSHRPLQTLKDSPVATNAMSSDAWERHIAQAAKGAKNLKRATPIASLAPRDPYFMRFIMPLFLIAAGMVGYGDNFERLRSSLSPTWQKGINPANLTFDAWVDPPSYTGRPPVYFKGKGSVDIPAGSELVARISGSKSAPRLKIISNGRSKYLPLKRLGPDSFEVRSTLDHNAKAQWRAGQRVQSWDINVLTDMPPTLSIDKPAEADKRDRLAMTYSFDDDYGVESLTLSMRLLETPSADKNNVEIPLPAGSVRKANKRDSALDMTKHIWTGRKVAGRLIATDGLGQSAISEEMFFTVPDKIFVEPMAKAIIEHRNLLLAGQSDYAPQPRRTRRDWMNMPIHDNWQTEDRMGRAPENIQRTATLIDALTDVPEGLFEDPALYMGLRYVSGRLRQARAQSELEGLPEYLWELAIRAEFGVLGTALEEMREAEASLNEGMARRAEQREMDTLFDRYDTAVDNYLEYLRDNAEQVDAEGGGEGSGRNVDEIQELLEAIEEANRIGDTEGARKALQKLAQLLENMKMQLAQGGSGGEGSQGSEMTEEMEESLEELADLLGKQRELQDETQQTERQEQESQQGSQSGQGSGSSSEDPSDSEEAEGLTAEELAAAQQKLAELLEQAKEGLPQNEGGSGDTPRPGSEQSGEAQGGEEGTENQTGQGSGTEDGEDGIAPGDALENAERAMADAEAALRAGELDDAAQAQADAIKALREAAQALAEQAGENLKGAENGEGENANPLGENNGAMNNGDSQADIDQRDNATRLRDLIDELRSRAAEQERDAKEREYIERLLKRF